MSTLPLRLCSRNNAPLPLPPPPRRYIQAAGGFLPYMRNKFAYPLMYNISGSLHTHLMAWKVDMDILGTANSVNMHTVGVSVRGDRGAFCRCRPARVAVAGCRCTTARLAGCRCKPPRLQRAAITCSCRVLQRRIAGTYLPAQIQKTQVAGLGIPIYNHK